MTAFKLKIYFFLFKWAADRIISYVFGKEVYRKLEGVVARLAVDLELTAQQRHNRARKFLDEVAPNVPTVMKNLAIEAVLARIPRGSQTLLQKIISR